MKITTLNAVLHRIRSDRTAKINPIAVTALGATTTQINVFLIAVSVAEDAILNDRVVATDVDEGDTLTYALLGDSPTGLTFRSDGTYSFDAESYEMQTEAEPARVAVAA